MTTPALNSAFIWQDQTLIFVATATTQQLGFFANNVTGTRVDPGLDGVCIAAVVPIPAAFPLLAGGLALPGLLERRKGHLANA